MYLLEHFSSIYPFPTIHSLLVTLHCNCNCNCLFLLFQNTPGIKSLHKSYREGLRQVWRHITMSTVLTQEKIPEEGRQ